MIIFNTCIVKGFIGRVEAMLLALPPSLEHCTSHMKFGIPVCLVKYYPLSSVQFLLTFNMFLHAESKVKSLVWNKEAFQSLPDIMQIAKACCTF